MTFLPGGEKVEVDLYFVDAKDLFTAVVKPRVEANGLRVRMKDFHGGVVRDPHLTRVMAFGCPVGGESVSQISLLKKGSICGRVEVIGVNSVIFRLPL